MTVTNLILPGVFSRRLAFAILLMAVALLAACSGNTDLGDGATLSMLDTSVGTPTVTRPARTFATFTPTRPPATWPAPTRTNTPFQIPTPLPTITPFVFPTRIALPTSALMGQIQTCMDLGTKGRNRLAIVKLEAIPKLAWDKDPHEFRVSLCNAISSSSAVTGRFRIFIYFPGSDRGRAESGTVQAQLPPGLNDVSIGPWIPGLQNHLSACAMQPTVRIEVLWDGTFDGTFQPITWYDGKGTLDMPIACGGDFS